MRQAAIDADAVVVGAGIVGLSIASRLSRERPGWRTVVVDRAAVGSGATRFSAGLHFPYGRTERTRGFARSMVDETARRRTAGGCDLIRQIGFVGVTSRAHRDEIISRFVLPTETRPAPERDLDDILGHGAYMDGREAFSVSGCHYAYPAAIAERIAAALNGEGSVRIMEGAEVVAVQSSRVTVDLALQDGRYLRARVVVLAVGPWTGSQPFDALLRPLDVRVKKVVAMHVDRRPRREDPAIFFHDEDAFLLPLVERGHWLFSYTSREWDVSPDDHRLQITARDREQALSTLAQYSVQLADGCDSGRVFCDAYSPAYEPLVTRLPLDNRIIYAGAACGSGYRFAPGMAEAACALLAA
jgi:glycine/D-amino acid oxidase-like deaminating enzyme